MAECFTTLSQSLQQHHGSTVLTRCRMFPAITSNSCTIGKMHKLYCFTITRLHKPFLHIGDCRNENILARSCKHFCANLFSTNKTTDFGLKSPFVHDRPDSIFKLQNVPIKKCSARTKSLSALANSSAT